MFFGCSKELSHRDGSVEYPQHMFWLRNKRNNFLLRTLIWGPEECSFFNIGGAKIYEGYHLVFPFNATSANMFVLYAFLYMYVFHFPWSTEEGLVRGY